MSYARFAEDSDVYVFLAVSGHLECCVCALDPESERFDTTDAMLAHLDEHRAAGHDVPGYALERLRGDRDEIDRFIREMRS